MSAETKQELVIQTLRKHGCRITSQRKLLSGIILEDACCSCKEIHYRAARQDPAIGIATVYRMVKILEESGLIQRRNLYRIDWGEAAVV